MKRKILRSLWLIPLIAGICLGIAGIVKLRKANDMYVPEMGEEGWFDASSTQSHAKMGSYVMIVGGFVFLPIVALAVGFIVKQATTTPEELAETNAKMLDENKRFEEKLKKLTGDDALNIYDQDELDTDIENAEENNDVFGADETENPFARVRKLQKSSSSRSSNKIKYCEFCGSANTGDAIKCASCGASFSKK